MNYLKILSNFGLKKEQKYFVRNYNNQLLELIIGNHYSGEGYCGITEDVIVDGKLIEIDLPLDSAIIWSNKFNLPCAVKLTSLELR